jgi:uncharacterized coiled-coil DUF342 family protein
MAISPIESGIRSARRRLIAQMLVNRLAVCWAVALGLAFVWVLVEPFAAPTATAHGKWWVTVSLFAVGSLAAIGWTIRNAPSRAGAALEIDNRFDLRERVTTALGLDDTLRSTSAGQAVLADAAATVTPLRMKDRFPVRPKWPAAIAPAFAGLIALAILFAAPDQLKQALAGEDTKAKTLDPLTVDKQDASKKVNPFAKAKVQDELDRQNKSEKLKDLESELEKLGDKFNKDREPNDSTKAREKVTELTKMEDKLKQLNDEKFQKLSKLDQKMQELERLNRDPDFNDGPAKELNDALSKGDLKKAKEEVDELKKKAKKDELKPEEKAQLQRQMEKMKDEIERLSRDKEKEKKLQDMIKKAKEQGKDAESLERELDKMKQENSGAEKAMQDLAEKMQKASDALKQGDMEELADQLEKIGSQMKEIEGDLQDLEDVQQYLQKLKAEKKKACAQCEGGECDGEGDPQRKDGAKWTSKGRPGMGERGEEKDDTSSTEEKQKGLFDPRGKKVYGGGVRGPAFTKKSTTELGKQIQEAVQEAPQAVDAQRLPRDARDSVKEYFENLGGNGKK